MDRPLAAFYLVLACCAFGLSVFVSRFVGNLVVLGAYIVFVGTTLTTAIDSQTLRTLRDRRLSELRGIAVPFRPASAILYPTLVLWAIFVIDLVLRPSLSALLRTGAFIVITGITLFVMPAVVSREHAFTAIGVVGAACMLLGLPAAVLGTPFRVAGVVLSTTSGAPLDPAGIVLHSPTAIFDTQNYFRVLVAIGTVASAGVFARTRNSWLALVCVLNAVGVYLTLGRAARLATVVAAGLAVVYLFAGRRALAGVTVVGVLATVIVFASALGIIPTIGPAETLRSALDKRLGYWGAAFETITVRPVLGWGLVDTRAAIGNRYAGFFRGVHNSYLRLFLIGGVIGGVAYLALCASALMTAFDRIREHIPLALTTFCLIVMALLFQLFAGGTIFGTSLSSVLWALTFGYAQHDISTERSTDTLGTNAADSANPISTDSE